GTAPAHSTPRKDSTHSARSKDRIATCSPGRTPTPARCRARRTERSYRVRKVNLRGPATTATRSGTASVTDSISRARENCASRYAEVGTLTSLPARAPSSAKMLAAATCLRSEPTRKGHVRSQLGLWSVSRTVFTQFTKGSTGVVEFLFNGAPRRGGT